MILRKNYLEWLIKNRENSLIKVLSGVRRSGKSTLFEIYKTYLKKDGIIDGQIIHLNFEDLRFFELRDFMKLNEYVLAKTDSEKQFYIFLDEIQHVYKFEEVVNSLNLQPNFDLYITGSNAYFMSGELATLLAGRCLEKKILPLSFAEFLSAQPTDNNSLTRSYNRYQQTAFPFLATIDDKEAQNDYIQAIYNDIVVKDVVTRYKITEQNLLERILMFLLSSIGTEISINRIANVLKNEGVAISNVSVEKFVDALVDGLILYKVPRYDIKGKNLLRRLEKYYVVDLGFRGLMLPDRVGDEGHLLENTVYLELRRRYRNVYIGRSDKYEVDFVCIDDNAIPAYYQVALQTLDETVLQREIRSLEAIKDSHPKFLLTLDTINPIANYNGIIKMNAIDWLRETK